MHSLKPWPCHSHTPSAKTPWWPSNLDDFSGDNRSYGKFVAPHVEKQANAISPIAFECALAPRTHRRH
jgi:hypothetical protein